MKKERKQTAGNGKGGNAGGGNSGGGGYNGKQNKNERSWK